jgi:hypothetical protein
VLAMHVESLFNAANTAQLAIETVRRMLPVVEAALANAEPIEPTAPRAGKFLVHASSRTEEPGS